MSVRWNRWVEIARNFVVCIGLVLLSVLLVALAERTLNPKSQPDVQTRTISGQTYQVKSDGHSVYLEQVREE